MGGILIRPLEGDDMRVATQVVHHLDLTPNILDVLRIDQPGLGWGGG